MFFLLIAMEDAGYVAQVGSHVVCGQDFRLWGVAIQVGMGFCHLCVESDFRLWGLALPIKLGLCS